MIPHNADDNLSADGATETQTLPDGAATLMLADETATLNLGATLAKRITSGLVVYLYGNLGAGKTTLVRGLLRALGHTGRVKSPTYTLVEPYELPGLTLHHYDLYRMNDPREWLDAGFRDDFSGTIACIVEWPEKAAGLLPQPDVEIHIEMEGEGRRFRLFGITARGRDFLRGLDVV